MSETHFLDERVQGWIEHELATTGFASIPLQHLELEPAAARRIVHAIAKKHDRKATTHLTPGGEMLLAEFTDWPRDRREQELQRRARAEAIKKYERYMAEGTEPN